MAPTTQGLSLKFRQRRHQGGFPHDPSLVLGNYLLSGSVSPYLKGIAPFGRSAYVDIVGLFLAMDDFRHKEESVLA